MRDVVNALALALMLPFFMGFLAACLLPPLCWWVEKRAAKAKAGSPVGDYEKRLWKARQEAERVRRIVYPDQFH